MEDTLHIGTETAVTLKAQVHMDVHWFVYFLYFGSGLFDQSIRFYCTWMSHTALNHRTHACRCTVHLWSMRQTEQLGRIVNELDTIHFSIKKAAQIVREIGKQVRI